MISELRRGLQAYYRKRQNGDWIDLLVAIRRRLDRWWRRYRARGAETIQQRHLAALRKANQRPPEDRQGRKPTTTGQLFIILNIDTEGPCGWCQNKNWSAVEAEVQAVMDPAFRRRFPDSNGAPPALSWFVVDWVGAKSSARDRDLGYHRIFDRYRPWVDAAQAQGYGDELHWHYHHVLPGNVESSNFDWLDFPQYEDILNRLVLDRGFFPACYRAGHTWEDALASHWLERWIPFDFSNRAPQLGANFDWSRAPRGWQLYHPALDDVQKPGVGRASQRRWMARSLSIENGWFREEEVEAAFHRARCGEDSYVSFFTHDYKAMADYLAEGLERIFAEARRHPQVVVRHGGALAALRALTATPMSPAPPLLQWQHNGDTIHLETDRPLHGPIPWIAARADDGTVHRLDALPTGERQWVLPLDDPPPREDGEASRWTQLAVAGCDSAGYTFHAEILTGRE
jgi:hypothetical protein